MLDRTGNSKRDIQFGRDRLARTADLILAGQPFGIDYGARRADRSADGFGKLENDVEVLFLLEL